MKSSFEERGGSYYQESDYFLPNLSVPEFPAIGIWGQRRRRYLKEHRQAFYTALLLSGKLNDHLSEIDKQAEDMFSQLVEQIAEQDGITEQLKAENQMEWVGRMHNIRKRQIMGRIEVPCEVCQNIHETHRDSPGVSVSFRYRGQQSPSLTGSAGEPE